MSILLDAGDGLGRATAPDYNTSYTWCGWRYWTSLAGSDVMVITATDANTQNLDAVAMNGSVANRLTYYEKEADNYNLDQSGGADLSTNTWYFVCLVRTTTALRLWLGDETNAVASHIASATGASAGRTGSNRCQIGYWDTLGTPNMRVYNDRIWTAALSQAELESERTSTTVVRSSNLWARWGFTTNTDLSDASGNGRDMSNVGAALTTAADPSLPGGGGGSVRTDFYHRLLRAGVLHA
jgi:hypothetical protein